MKQQDLDKHVVFTLIDQIDAKLSGLHESKPRPEQVEEVVSKVEFLKWILEKSEASLLAVNDLNFVRGHLQNIVDHLPASGSKIPHYSNISNWFSEIFARLPYPRMRKIHRNEASDKVREFTSEVDHELVAIRAQSESARQELVKLKNEIGEINSGVAQSSKELADIRARIDAEVLNLKSQAGAATSQKISDFEAEFSQLRSNSTRAISSFENDGKTVISKMRASLTESEKEAMSQFLEFKSEVDGDLETFRSDASDTLDKIKELYQISGETAMAGGFSTAASEESRRFFWYSTFAALLIVGAAGCLIYSLQVGGGLASLEPLAVLSRIPITLLILLPGAYLASIAGRARQSAMYLRSLSLRIAAFDAYLTNWPDQDQANEHREKMMSVFFDPDEGEHEKEAKQIVIGGGGQAFKILEKLLDRVTIDGK